MTREELIELRWLLTKWINHQGDKNNYTTIKGELEMINNEIKLKEG